MTAQRLELLDSRRGPARANPLINALVEQLPPPGEDFPADERKAWLEMMEKAFTMAYGGSKENAAPRRPGPPQRPKHPKRPNLTEKPSRAAKPIAPGPAFYVDKQHFARKRGGDRIMPADVMDVLVDQRGVNGDIGRIIWADDSTGIPRGLQLDITIADVSGA